ncbi:SDR family oxidoreductase [Kribbella sp. NPDC050820]|uniref:SDR family NAD(P)-dependent oxidoreductase n=1 Tax=Kribbella sp. NPDC050820 TaxID=3155408 RepID=UPI0033D675A5
MTAVPEYDGLVAIVTGGGSGIGAAVVRELIARGARVVAIDLDPSNVPADVLGVKADVTDDESVRTAVQQAVDAYGRIDVVVNNAGVGAQGTVEDNPDDQWHQVFDVNVMGAVRVSRAALPYLRQSPAAAIVNVASVAATTGIPQRALYSTTKGAVQSLTMAMAADHLREGIRVNCVNPGTADTPWVQRLLGAAPDPQAERAALDARQPHGRLVSAEEVALAVVYLAGPSSGSTAGTALAVDGGMATLRLRPRN